MDYATSAHQINHQINRIDRVQSNESIDRPAKMVSFRDMLMHLKRRNASHEIDLFIRLKINVIVLFKYWFMNFRRKTRMLKQGREKAEIWTL